MRCSGVRRMRCSSATGFPEGLRCMLQRAAGMLPVVVSAAGCAALQQQIVTGHQSCCTCTGHSCNALHDRAGDP